MRAEMRELGRRRYPFSVRNKQAYIGARQVGGAQNRTELGKNWAMSAAPADIALDGCTKAPATQAVLDGLPAS